jgi:putative membrane protein
MRLSLPKNDRVASWVIWIFSIIVFVAVTALENVTIEADLGFSPQIFPLINAYINSTVALLLLAGLIAAKSGKYVTHKKIMLTAILLSVICLVI